MEGFVSRTDFARIYGCSKAYVSQLGKEGRLVLSEDGKTVDVEATFEQLKITSDPSKAGVRERWAAFRAGRDGAPGEQLAIDVPAAEPRSAAGETKPAAAETKAPPAERQTSKYHDARAQREQAEAQMAELELRRQLGALVEVEEVLRAIADTHTAARTEILALPDRLATLVAAETDPRKVYDLVATECERVCQNIAERAAKMATKVTA